MGIEPIHDGYIIWYDISIMYRFNPHFCWLISSFISALYLKYLNTLYYNNIISDKWWLNQKKWGQTKRMVVQRGDRMDLPWFLWHLVKGSGGFAAVGGESRRAWLTQDESGSWKRAIVQLPSPKKKYP